MLLERLVEVFMRFGGRKLKRFGLFREREEMKETFFNLKFLRDLEVVDIVWVVIFIFNWLLVILG